MRAEGPALAQWLARLEQLHPRSIDLGLKRVGTVADRLGLRPFPAPVITVAGTNGKGSVTRCAQALLTASGLRTGAFTSPHLLRFNERIAIDGVAVTDDAVCAAFAAIDEARGEITLTYFEFAALAALWLFRRQRVQAAVLEVGLGGRLDAVNVIDAQVAVITRIGLDHQEWLGRTVQLIGREKAGIARRGQVLVLAEDEYPVSLEATVRAAGASPMRAGRDWHWQASADAVTLHLPGQNPLWLPVPAGLRAGNVAAAACAASRVARLVPAPVRDALRGLVIPGRQQRLPLGAGELLLDVAHNPDAAAALARRLHAGGQRRTHAIFAALADKDLENILRPRGAQLSTLRLCALPGVRRAASVEALTAAALASGWRDPERAADPGSALLALLPRLKAGDRVLGFGSFYTVASIMRQLDVAGLR